MRILAPAIVTLSLCLAGCGGRTGNDAAGAGEGAAANAAVANAAGNAAVANAATPAGPCPFEIRNVRALRSGIPDAPPGGGGGAAVYVSTLPDLEGRYAQISQRESPPPNLVVDIDRDPAAPAQAMREWSEVGLGGYPATPDYTHAVVRCAGREVARVPIQP